MYEQGQLDALRAALQDLLKDGPADKACGVCRNLHYHEALRGYTGRYIDGYDFIENEAFDWPHALKHADEDGAPTLLPYFVPGDGCYALWDGQNLEMRQNLLRYLLGRVAHHEAELRGGVALAG